MFGIGDLVIGIGVYDEYKIDGQKGVIVEANSDGQKFRVQFSERSWWCPKSKLKKYSNEKLISKLLLD